MVTFESHYRYKIWIRPHEILLLGCVYACLLIFKKVFDIIISMLGPHFEEK